MKITKAKTLAWFLAAILLTACHHEEKEEPQPEQHTQRTLLMFLPWASDLQWAFDSNVKMAEKNIRENGGLQGQRLLVFRSTSEYDASLVEIYCYRDSCYHDTLRTYRNFRPTTIDHLSAVVNDMRVLAPSETGRYAMLVGCHGSGWITVNSWFGAKGQGAGDDGPQRAIGGNTSDTQMDIADFAEGIRATGLTMDFICFDDCYMAGIETAYDLREVTTWLVASTCEIMDYGLPYDLIFSDLTALTPRWPDVMQKFYNFYKAYSTPCGTLSAIDCREVEATAALMRQINAQYAFDEELLQEVQPFDGMQQHIFFDMGDYVDHLCPDEALRSSMHQQLERLVPSKTHTETFYSVYNWMWNPILSYSGIAISDPTVNVRAVRAVQGTSWWKATHD